MYELPSDFDALVFVGHCLESLTFTENTIQLNFGGDDKLFVTSESSIVYERFDTDDGVPEVRKEETKPSETHLARLVGREVTSAVVKGNFCLQLYFGNEGSLCFDGASKQYEMYRIVVGTRELIV